MYGDRDIYGAPISLVSPVYRSKYEVEGEPPEVQPWSRVDQIADKVVEGMEDSFGLNVAGILGDVQGWAKGLVDPEAKIKDWKRRLNRLAGKWKSFDERGDSQADKIASKMVGLVSKIQGRTADWKPSKKVSKILSKYKAPTKPEETTAVVKASPESISLAERKERVNELATAWKKHQEAGHDDEAKIAHTELMELAESIVEEDEEWDPSDDVASAIESYGASRYATLFDDVIAEAVDEVFGFETEWDWEEE